MLDFTLQPNAYQTGADNNLRSMLERIWVREHTSGVGTLYIVSGFSNFNGGARFYNKMLSHTQDGGSVKAFLGGSASQRLSSKQVVEALLEIGVDVNLVTRNRLLHAKCYGVSGTDEDSLIVSSGNFTGPGMSQNIEASLLLKGDDFSRSGFSWSDLECGMRQQDWQIYRPTLEDREAPAWGLLYDERARTAEQEDVEIEQTMVLLLVHSDTARINAPPGSTAGRGSQYFWLSKDCFDFFPALLERNRRGWKGTYSTKINLNYIDLNQTHEVRVTFEADNNLDFRLGTGALRHSQLCRAGDLAAITRLSDMEYELRLYRNGSTEYGRLEPYAITAIGHQGKRFGFLDNRRFFSELKGKNFGP